jgi:hypothetical protein
VIYGGGENGGYIMTRAAAHAKHVAACILDPLISDMEPIAPLFLRNVFSRIREQGVARIDLRGPSRVDVQPTRESQVRLTVASTPTRPLPALLE